MFDYKVDGEWLELWSRDAGYEFSARINLGEKFELRRKPMKLLNDTQRRRYRECGMRIPPSGVPVMKLISGFIVYDNEWRDFISSLKGYALECALKVKRR